MKPLILNRAGMPPNLPEAEGPWASVEALFEKVFGRLAALEKLPTARDGRDGLPGRDGGEGKPGQSIQGERGLPGKDGRDGESIQGERGPEGRGVKSLIIDLTGHMVVQYTDGETKDLGNVIGPAGRDGRDGESIQGERGEPGRDGKDGRDGRAIVSAKTEDGCLLLTFTDGNVENAGRVEGQPGKAGLDGKEGQDGKPGADGKAGQSIKGERGEPGKDGRPGRDGKDSPVIAAASVEIGDVFRANISAKDIDRLMVRELTVNGETFQVLVPN